VVEAEIFDRRLERLEQTIADLRGIATMPAKALVADRALQAQAERWTQVAVEASIDLANHLIAARGWTTPATYRDAFRILAQHGVIDDAAAQKMAGWAGLRNIIVHLYLDVDHVRLHEVLVNELDDLLEFAAALARTISRSSGT
jgi:uncharacterized protein YutE (UPF0331/DUF86 family)